MNAHTPAVDIRAATPSEVLGYPADCCPVAALGPELRRLQVALDRQAGAVAADKEVSDSQLWDRVAHLQEVMEWRIPTSLEGVFMTVAQMGSLAGDLGDATDAHQIAELRRRVDRLKHAALAGLSMIGGIDRQSVGAGLFTCDDTTYRQFVRGAEAGLGFKEGGD